jgi:O-antigen ligase
MIVPAFQAFRIALLAAGLSVLTFVVDRFARARPLSVVTLEMTLVVALVAWAIATVPFSRWPGGSLAVLLDVYLKSVVVFWLLANVLSTGARVYRLVSMLCLLAIPLALAGVQNYVFGGYLQGTTVRRIMGYDAPLTLNPNDLALLLNLIIPLTVGLLLTRPRPLMRAVLIAGLVLDVAGVVVSFSRAGFLTLAATTLAYVWKLRGRPERRWALGAVALAVACLPLLPAGYVDRLASMTDTRSDRTGSAQARRDDTGAALRFVADHPIVGAGIGQDALALNEERGPRWTAVHNVYLQHAVELGLPGLVLFVALLGASIRSAGRATRRTEGDTLSPLAHGTQVSLIAFAVGGLFHPVAYHFYFYYVAGIAVALKALTPLAPAPRWRR